MKTRIGAKTQFTLIVLSLQFLVPTASFGIEIQYRPFGILADSLLQNVDGWFDTSLGVQKIGIPLTNTTGDTVTTLMGTLSFENGSGILGTAVNYSFGNIAPGQSVLGIFEADFSAASPAKTEFTLNLSGDNFNDTQSRAAFVASSAIVDPLSTFDITTPQGTLRAEHFSFYKDVNPAAPIESLMAPTSLKWAMTPTTPFSGQFSEIPFQDPWWKAAGLGALAGSGINMIIDGIAEACGEDYLDPAGEKINTGIGVTGGAAFAADIVDPFRRGEENTIPLGGLTTTLEEVVMDVSYDAPPIPQEPFTGTVDWTFTRYLSDDSTLIYSVSETFQNEHFSTARTTAQNKSLLSPGDNLVLTSTLDSYAETDVYLAAMISRLVSDMEKQFVQSAIMFDDGTNGDQVSGDGVYTAVVPIVDLLTKGTYIYDVFAQDINKASETDPAIIAAQEIGGFMIGHSTSAGMRVLSEHQCCDIVEDGRFTVPEPTTLALVGVGLAGLAFTRRRVHLMRPQRFARELN